MADRVLVVDPDADAWAPLIPVLKDNDFRVTIAADGLVALNAAEKLVPSAVIMEVYLPRLHGFELCRRLQGQNATARYPILFVSTNNEETVIVDAFAAGAWDYLLKPLRPAELVARLRAHLRLAHGYSAPPAHDNAPSNTHPITPTAQPISSSPVHIDPTDSLNLARMEAMLINRALAETKGNVARAARLLGINRSRIYRKFKTTGPESS